MRIKKPLTISETNIKKKNSSSKNKIQTSTIKELIGHSEDIVIREIVINPRKSLVATLVYAKSLSDTDNINSFILKPLFNNKELDRATNYGKVLDALNHKAIYISNKQEVEDVNILIDKILTGFSALVFDTEYKAIVFQTVGSEERSITEPTEENVIKGAKDSFIESRLVNYGSIRKKIKSPDLVIEEIIVGEQTKTSIGIVFMKNIANPKLVNRVKKRLSSISVDGVLTTSFIEENIVDEKSTLFPLVDYTVRPDKFSSNIIEGRVGLIIDGIAIGVIIPATLAQFLQAPEDYSHNWIVASIIRLFRYSLLIISFLLPAFYISITTFNQEMIPSKLIFSLSTAREGVPFPTYIEVIIMLLAFEVLQEAGVRLPKAIGQTVSIVGALIVGEAAVTAKIVSPAIIIVVAVSGITSYALPSLDLSAAIRVTRLLLIVLSSVLGLFGLGIGMLFVIYHLSTIETFGVPYMSPFVTNEGGSLEDSLIRFPIPSMKKRPLELKTSNENRR